MEPRLCTMRLVRASMSSPRAAASWIRPYMTWCTRSICPAYACLSCCTDTSTPLSTVLSTSAMAGTSCGTPMNKALSTPDVTSSSFLPCSAADMDTARNTACATATRAGPHPPTLESGAQKTKPSETMPASSTTSSSALSSTSARIALIAPSRALTCPFCTACTPTRDADNLTASPMAAAACKRRARGVLSDPATSHHALIIPSLSAARPAASSCPAPPLP
mmetsp:Transcript_27966/g.54610  ORF Transcript_27966/g.54610 Transcript_27966/m.54610 type:complete len:221 (-) Transcript_27966:240-902(-)